MISRLQGILGRTSTYNVNIQNGNNHKPYRFSCIMRDIDNESLKYVVNYNTENILRYIYIIDIQGNFCTDYNLVWSATR